MRLRLLAAVATAAALSIAALGPAHATDPSERKRQVDAQVRQLAVDIDDVSAQLRDAVLAQQAAERQLPVAQAAEAKAQAQLAAAQARDAELGRRLTVAREQEDAAQRELDATVRRLLHSKLLIGRVAREAYQQGTISQLAVVLDAASPEDFATRLVLVESALRSQGSVINQLAADRTRLAASKAALTAKREQVAAMKADQAQTVARVQLLTVAALAARQRLQGVIAARTHAVAVVAQQKVAEQARYAAMQAESAQLERMLEQRAAAARAAAARAAAARAAAARAGRSAVPPPATGGGVGTAVSGYIGGSGTLSYPVNGPITSPFGMRVNPVTGVYKLHDGTDFGVPCGTPVHAAAAGTVVSAGLRVGYGNQLAIDHGVLRGQGVATSYNHLSAFAASPGQRVSRGQVVAYSGNTGFSTGCHLHFMVYVNGTPVNPMGWL